MKNNNYSITHLIITSAILSIIILCYFYIFHGELSHNSNDWGNFGSYIGGAGSVILSISIFYYTYSCDKRHQKEMNTQKLLNITNQISSIISNIYEYKNIENFLKNSTIYQRGLDNFLYTSNQAETILYKIKGQFKSLQIMAYSLSLSPKPIETKDINIEDIMYYITEWQKDIYKKL